MIALANIKWSKFDSLGQHKVLATTLKIVLDSTLDWLIKAWLIALSTIYCNLPGLASKVICRGIDSSCFWITSLLLLTLKDFKQSCFYSSIALAIAYFYSSLRSASVTAMMLSVSNSVVAMLILFIASSHCVCQKMCWCKSGSANTKG